MTTVILLLGILFTWIVCVGIVGLLAGGVAWMVVRPAVRPMVPAFAVQAGYTLVSFPAMLILFFLGEFDVMTTMIGLLLLCGITAVLVWLIVRPGPIPVIVLTIFHIVDFSLACLFGAGDLQLAAYGGLAASFLLRATGIALMVVGLWIISRAQRPVVMSAVEDV